MQTAIFGREFITTNFALSSRPSVFSELVLVIGRSTCLALCSFVLLRGLSMEEGLSGKVHSFDLMQTGDPLRLEQRLGCKLETVLDGKRGS